MHTGRGWDDRGLDVSRLRAARRSGRLGSIASRVWIASWTGSSELERDLRTSRIQEGSSEFLIELRTRLGFWFVIAGFGS